MKLHIDKMQFIYSEFNIIILEMQIIFFEMYGNIFKFQFLS